MKKFISFSLSYLNKLQKQVFTKPLFIFYAVGLLYNLAGAQSFPGGFNAVLFKDGLDLVEGMRFDSTGQMYVWEKSGKVWVIDTLGIKHTTPLIDIHSEVGDWRDHGLNGFALDPDFRNNGYYYLFYTVDRHYLLYFGKPQYHPDSNEYYKATICRVTRYTANPATNFKTTLAGSRKVLIGETKKTGIAVLHESHSGGQLTFGADGSLLVSTGDGASYAYADGGGGSSFWSQALADSIIRVKENVGSYRAQLVDCLNGKILRINPATGNGYPSNPYYTPANPRSAKSRVWCLGLRNPYRMCLRPGTGSTDVTAGNPGVIYIGDVGWTEREDLNVATGPAVNFGWPLFEGLTPATDYTPLMVYNRDAVNPLHGSGCTKKYFQFKHLCIRDTNTVTPSFPNPCNLALQIPATIPTFKHTGPVIDWRHNVPEARTQIWVGNSAVQVNLNDSASPVMGQLFAGNCSVGGTWYTGSKYPATYQNTYFHADLGDGWIKTFVFDSLDKPVSVSSFASGENNIVALEYNPKDQCIYYVKYPDKIFRIDYIKTPDYPPTAIATLDTSYGITPLTVQFHGDNSTDPENQPLTYLWNFGDGFTDTVANPVHTFIPLSTNPLANTVTLTVTDTALQSASATIIVFLNNTPPQVNITSFNDGDLYTMSHNTILPLAASVYDAEHSPSQLTWQWQTVLHHDNHEHPEPYDNDSVTYTILSPIGCDTVSVFYYAIKLTVTDSCGLSSMVQKNVYPSCTPPVADFTSDKITTCLNDSIKFTDLSSGFPDTWNWSFPGGSPSTSTLQNPVIYYPAAGAYNVTLTATNTRGSATITKTGYIEITPSLIVTVTPNGTDTVCAGTPVVLNTLTAPNPGITYQWLKNNSIITGATKATYTANTAGSFKVMVSKTIPGCTGTSGIKKIVNRTVNATIAANGPPVICNDSVTLSVVNNISSAYLWRKNNKWINGAVYTDYTASVIGLYNVKVTDGFGCTKISNSINVSSNCKLLNGDSLAFNAELYPNPADESSMLNVTVRQNDVLNIKVADYNGRVVSAIADNLIINDGGVYQFNIDTSKLGAGVYTVYVSTLVEQKNIKLIVVE